MALVRVSERRIPGARNIYDLQASSVRSSEFSVQRYKRGVDLENKQSELIAFHAIWIVRVFTRDEKLLAPKLAVKES